MTIQTFIKHIRKHYNVALKQTGKTSYVAETPNGLLLLFARTEAQGKIIENFEIFGGSYSFILNLNSYDRWNKEVLTVIDKAYYAMMAIATMATNKTTICKREIK